MSYPTTIDSIPQPSATSPTNAPSASAVSVAQTTAIEALETKVGIGASTPATATPFFMSTGAGSSGWGSAATASTALGLGSLALLSIVNLTTNVTGILPVANGGTGNTTGTATVNANLTGPITSVGNATSIASQTGTGSKFVVDTSPTIVTPTIASFANANHTHQSSVGGGTLSESALNLTDVTTGNVSTSAHGFTPKAPNDTTKFLRGDASWAVAPYTLQAYLNVAPPANSTAYYNAFGFNTSTSVSFGRIYIPRAGTLNVCYISVETSGTVGTSETSIMSIRLNNTTDTTISNSVITSSGLTNYSNTSMGVTVAAGDYINVKLVTPAWVTTPGNIATSITIFIT